MSVQKVKFNYSEQSDLTGILSVFGQSFVSRTIYALLQRTSDFAPKKLTKSERWFREVKRK